jgi:hypothetical protein
LLIINTISVSLCKFPFRGSVGEEERERGKVLEEERDTEMKIKKRKEKGKERERARVRERERKLHHWRVHFTFFLSLSLCPHQTFSPTFLLSLSI